MAVTQNTYTGNGSTVLYSFTFPYLEESDIKVSLNGTLTTAYTLANASTVQFNTAPANGAAVRIYRSTDDSQTKATFFAGSSIRAQSLNDNFTQSFYIAQETAGLAGTALSTVNTANSNASAAVATANTALSSSASALSTANTASTNASNAVTTANSVISTATTASANASSAVSTANSAIATANATAANVANARIYALVANVAAIPGSPSNNTGIEVTNSTSIEGFTPLSGTPVGFVGGSGLSVRIIYNTAASTWTWVQYFPNDPENRYLKLAGGTLTGPLTNALGTAALPALTFASDTNTGIYSPDSDQLAFTTQGVEKLRIGSVGQLGIGGATYGTSGQVLTSGGTNAAPTWTNPSSYDIISSVAVASTSGASINFTNIPAGVKRITVLFNGVSTTATGNFNLIVRLGTAAGGISSTGYSSNASSHTSGSLSVISQTTGFLVNRGSFTFNITGAITLALLEEGANLTWVASGTYFQPIVPYMGYVSGSKTFTSAIDRVSVATVDANTFTAGSINILYES